MLVPRFTAKFMTSRLYSSYPPAGGAAAAAAIGTKRGFRVFNNQKAPNPKRANGKSFWIIRQS